ncbi:MAG: nucleotidyltransferase [Elusimicrobia bacterium RIFOXYC2_FULL_34_12]|nr:MAG: nucleotidyltransferase [Elusimicrobia bacterium RIFOXYC2_FULL_34_12]
MKSLKETKETLKKYKPILKSKYGVKEIGIFGSYVRGEANKKSDIDILVNFQKNCKTYDNYMELGFFLKKLLKNKIDLVLKNVIRKELKKNILSQTIYV